MRPFLKQENKTKNNASKKPSAVFARIFNNGLIHEQNQVLGSQYAF
jgi:hypothetical protein